MGKSFEPVMPKFLCLFKINFPSIFFMSLVLDFDQLRWDRNSSRLYFSQSSRLNTPFNGCLLGLEKLGPITKNLVHKRQSLNRSPLNDINYYSASNTLVFLAVSQEISDPSTDRTSQRMSNKDKILLRIFEHSVLQNLNRLVYKCVYRHILQIFVAFRKAMSLHIISNKSSKMLNLLSQSSKTHSRVPSPMKTEKNSSFLSSPKKRCALDQYVFTSSRKDSQSKKASQVNGQQCFLFAYVI